MKNEWDTSIPIEDLFGKIYDAHKYSILENNAYSEQAFVDADESVHICTKSFVT